MGQITKDGERKLTAFAVLGELESKLALLLQLGLDSLQFMEEGAQVERAQTGTYVIIPVWELPDVRPLGYLKITVASSSGRGVMFCGVAGTFRETHDGWERVSTH